MPKVISRSAISASKDEDTRSNLRVFYCLCGEFALVCDQPLSACPSRPQDGSYVLRCLDSRADPETGYVRKARIFKISATQRDPVLIRRPDGSLEKQYRFHCQRCQLPLGYETTVPPLKSGNFTYILKGALSEAQGTAPPDALWAVEAEEP
ncbi:hypothetical protein K437DRAFT_253556 [Tilletiaria anomala UBC 951]|uniref:STEEP1 domain-containing protein n=1 Tax=Tilletiaria anomala (strain ATCC 24038 / CBS 436.72 / UBC 951) TaxID=1037660 RepID=A0A066WPL2_TILAU|nr:uncharacterized protein K437DRAFT_253556 [Tilletiaria anomala UBC 951]KDN52924.1 hypothetical protein K437DRAFT_253556 [Tilletiaria anomala UBC 951]